MLLTASIAAAQTPAERPVHRFLTVALSPDGKRVASVEGNSPRPAARRWCGTW